MGRIGGLLGPSWGAFRPVGVAKIVDFYELLWVFLHILPDVNEFSLMVRPGVVQGHLRPVLGAREPVLAASWRPLGPSGAPLGPSWAPLGPSWAPLGGLLGRHGGLLRRLGASSGRPGAILARLGTPRNAPGPPGTSKMVDFTPIHGSILIRCTPNPCTTPPLTPSAHTWTSRTVMSPIHRPTPQVGGNGRKASPIQHWGNYSGLLLCI